MRRIFGFAAISFAVLAFSIGETSRAQAQVYTVLHNFTGPSTTGSDGAWPQGMIEDSSGNFYGVSVYGGDASVNSGAGDGTVFELVNSNGSYTEKVLYTFHGGADGDQPGFGLVRDSSGNLYGVTERGGGGNGSVFELTPSGTLTTIYTFSGTVGSYLTGPLLLDSSGDLFGTTTFGGTGTCALAGEPAGCGTVFELVNSSGTYTLQTLHNFQGLVTGGTSADLSSPFKGLTMDASGDLYGTTLYGGDPINNGVPGAAGCGGVFELTNSNGLYTYQILYRFTGGPNDGCQPGSGVLLDSAGNLYGTTTNGELGSGTVYKLSPSGSETTLLTFNGAPTGTYSTGTLVMDNSGNLYGTTTGGGAYSNYGTVFKLNSQGNETILHSFSGSDGWDPQYRLVLDSSGNLFGTTVLGGAGPCDATHFTDGCGVAFKLTTTNYAAQAQPPIASDGSSVFKANRGVVPVKFTLEMNGQATCSLPPAVISLVETSGSSPGPINQDEYEMTADSGTNFRIDTAGCQYVYNLGAKSLGPGTYEVFISINGAPVGDGIFGLQ